MSNTIYGFSRQVISLGIYAMPALTAPEIYTGPVTFVYAYGWGLQAGLKVHNRLSLETEIGYKQKATEGTFDASSIDYSMNYSNNSFQPFESFDWRSERQFAGISVLGNYKLSKSEEKKIWFYISAGLGMDYYFKQKNVVEYFDRTETRYNKPDETSFSFSAILGPGIQFKLFPKIQMQISPRYAYDINEPKYGYKYQAFQLKFGVMYHLDSKIN